jgi:hypothetical protein
MNNFFDFAGITENHQELQLNKFGMQGNSTNLLFTLTLVNFRISAVECLSKFQGVCSSLASCCSFTGLKKKKKLSLPYRLCRIYDSLWHT